MNWFKKLFTKEKWFLIKTYDLFIRVEGEEGYIYFYLFESDIDNRKVEIGHTYNPATTSGESLALQLRLYNEIIYPWLCGVDFKEIPSNPIPDNRKRKIDNPILKTEGNITYLNK